MPLYGVRATDELLEHAATMDGLDTQPVELPGAEVLQVMFEIDDRSLQSLLPPALHPTIPPSVTFVFWRCPEGPLGSFQMAQVRAGCRAGVRPRGLPLATWCDSEQAAEALRRRWGFNCRPGEVRLKRNYDRIAGTVTEAGRTVLRVSLIDPQAISGGDVQYVANMNLALVPREGGVQ
ncbi:MAG: acetoacetate decarboxylase family protein, partial [Dehalococcoidia bacterium]